MVTLFDIPDPNPAHPAEYTEVLYPTMARMLQGCTCILDPFGGVGGVFMLERWLPGAKIHAVELEPEWAKCNPKTEQGNALYLRWADHYFDGICTSPTYGNRMADGLMVQKETWKKAHKYITYAQYLKRKLHPDNSGGMQWGRKYRELHVKAWVEARRVLRDGGIFVLNIKDHIRAGKIIAVTDWHVNILRGLGFSLIKEARIETPGMGKGANRELRVPYESVIQFRLNKPSLYLPDTPE